MKVSIAIPFYNNEEHLPDAIKSVFAQDFKDWELILIDDGSTDRSLEIAKSVIDSRVRVISDGKNKKLAARLNQVTLLAKYDYIARMDADDIMAPNRISNQLEIFKQNPEIDIVSTSLISISDNKKILGVRQTKSNEISLKDLISRKKQPVHATILATKKWYMRNKYDENLPISQDYELWLRAASKKDFNVIMTEDLAYFYREGLNIKYKKIRLSQKIERRIYKKYANNSYFSLYLKSILKTFLTNIIFLFGLSRILLARRNNILNINNNIEKNYKLNIKKIESTFVPGLSEYLNEKR